MVIRGSLPDPIPALNTAPQIRRLAKFNAQLAYGTRTRAPANSPGQALPTATERTADAASRMDRRSKFSPEV